MSDFVHFLKASLRNPTHIGALAPSSPALARAMVHDLHPASGELVLELGPGTGAFTHFLQHHLPNKEAYVGIERDAHFVSILRNRFPGLHFVHGDAGEAHQIVQEHGQGELRYILSGLPFAILPTVVRDAILASLHQLMVNGCTFRTFQYVHAAKIPQAIAFREIMTARYGTPERSPLVVRNLPPAYTYTWRSIHAD